MTRRILLVSLLAIALVGFAESQGASEKEEDAAEKAALKEVLAFHEQDHKAKIAGDRKALDTLYADGFTFISERFGRGESFNKAQYLDFRLAAETPLQLIKAEHDTVYVHFFGSPICTAVMTGHSKTILSYKGKPSSGPRLFTFVFVKQHGLWQCVSMHVSDIPNGNAPFQSDVPNVSALESLSGGDSPREHRPKN